MTNPYEYPREPQLPVRAPAIRPSTQIMLVAIAVGFVVLYNLLQLRRIPSGRPVPLWPTLLIPFVLSILSAFRSLSVSIPPLTVVLGIMSAVPVFAAARGWRAAEPHIALLIAITLAAPSFFVARSSRVRRSL